MKNGFENIKVSDKLDKVIDCAVNKAIIDKKRKTFQKRIFTGISCAAASFAVFVGCINYIPAFAEAAQSAPGISSIAQAVKFNYNKNIGIGIEKGLAENAGQTKTDKGIKVSIDKVMADDKNLYILYSLDGSSYKGNMKNLLLSNLQISDSKNNVLADCKYISGFLPPYLEGKEGNTLVPMNSYGYKCIITSLESNNQSYSENHKAAGLIQLSADNLKNEANSIPDEIKLSVLGFTEAYNVSYDKETYNSFIAKYNRQPADISVNCDFNIKTNKKLSTIKTYAYNNIKFTANNTDFEIKYLNIYPSYSELKIQLGKNKNDNAQCTSIMNKYKLTDSDSNTLCYLVDDKGNKYMPTRRHAVYSRADNTNTITFDSPYFNEPKELYLVINQLQYSNNNSMQVIDGAKIKVRIK